jgi:hypothetical protein
MTVGIAEVAGIDSPRPFVRGAEHPRASPGGEFEDTVDVRATVDEVP